MREIKLSHADLCFDAESHTYYLRDGDDLYTVPSVTQICRLLDDGKSFRLMNWAKSQYRRSIQDSILADETYSQSDLDDAHRIAWKADMRTLKESGNYGSAVHALIEDRLQGQVTRIAETKKFKAFLGRFGLAYSDEIRDQMKSAVESFEEWVSDLEILDVERPVYSPLGYAGTLDILASDGDSELIIDLKTSKGVYLTYSMQVAAYWAAYYEDTLNDSWSIWPDVPYTGVVFHMPKEGEACPLYCGKDLPHVREGAWAFGNLLNLFEFTQNHNSDKPPTHPWVWQKGEKNG